MQVYRCNLTLQDYLFFATTERGKVAETGAFIHNYALTYALGWAVSSFHNEVQKPRYKEELAQVKKRYITPAKLVQGSMLLSQYNTMNESYSLEKARSIGYPDWGFIKCFRPGSLFRCYVLSAEEVQFPHFLRLGKFMAKTALHITSALKIQRLDKAFKVSGGAQQQPTSPLLAWNDLARTSRPVAYDMIVNALPGHLIDHPVFDEEAGPCLLVDFAEDELPVQIPLDMGYYGENLCVSW